MLNKVDLLLDPPPWDLDDERIVRIFRVSCATGAGIDELRRALFELCPAAPPPVAEEPELAEFLEYRPRPARVAGYRIYRTDRGFRVVGDAPEGRRSWRRRSRRRA